MIRRFHLTKPQTSFSGVPKGFQSLTSHWVQCNQVKDCHKSNTDVTEIPHSGVCRKSADEEHYESHDFVSSLITPFISEQVGYIGTGIEQNSDKGGKTEHCQGSCNKNRAEGSKVVLHSSLQQIHADKPVSEILWNEQQDHGGTGTDNDGIDKYTK